jgi:hypothetical protein
MYNKMDNEEIKRVIKYVDYKIKELSSDMDFRPCIKPDVCMDELKVKFDIKIPFKIPFKTYKNKPIESLDDFCKDYCYFRYCFLDDELTRMRQKKMELENMLSKTE